MGVLLFLICGGLIAIVVISSGTRKSRRRAFEPVDFESVRRGVSAVPIDESPTYTMMLLNVAATASNHDAVPHGHDGGHCGGHSHDGGFSGDCGGGHSGH